MPIIIGGELTINDLKRSVTEEMKRIGKEVRIVGAEFRSTGIEFKLSTDGCIHCGGTGRSAYIDPASGESVDCPFCDTETLATRIKKAIEENGYDPKAILSMEFNQDIKPVKPKFKFPDVSVEDENDIDAHDILVSVFRRFVARSVKLKMYEITHILYKMSIIKQYKRFFRKIAFDVDGIEPTCSSITKAMTNLSRSNMLQYAGEVVYIDTAMKLSYDNYVKARVHYVEDFTNMIDNVCELLEIK